MDMHEMLKPTVRKLVTVFFSALLPVMPALAQDGAERTVDQTISEAIAPIINPFVGFIFSPMPGSEALLGTAFPWIVL